MSSRFALPQSISNILSKRLKQLDIDSKIEEYKIVEKWEELVGKTIATHSCASKVSHHSLIIEVNHSAWMTELRLMKEILLKKIRQNYPKANLKDIRFILKR